MHRVMRIFALALMTCTVASCASSTSPTGMNSTESLAAALRARGAVVTIAESLPRSSNPFFAANAQVVRVNESRINVFEFASSADAKGDAAKVGEDGSSVGTTMITWIDSPHFYLSGRLIVTYAGSDIGLLQLLDEVLGPAFAPRKANA